MKIKNIYRAAKDTKMYAVLLAEDHVKLVEWRPSDNVVQTIAGVSFNDPATKASALATVNTTARRLSKLDS